MSQKLFKDDIKVDTSRYAMLADVAKYAKKPIYTNLFFSFEDADEQVIEQMEKFFTYKSLKQALKETFNISAKDVTQFIQSKLFEEDTDRIKLNLNYFLALDVLSHIFLKQDKPNFDSFLKCLKDPKVRAMLAPYYNKKQQVQNFLTQVFTEEQKIKVLTQSGLYDEIGDTAGMFLQHDDFFLKFYKRLPFNQMDTFQKCHDLMVKEEKKITEKNFHLHQEAHHPNLESVEGFSLADGYKVVIPRTHHDLVLWGTELGHCIGSRMYAEQALKGGCLLLGIEKNKEIKYTLEIQRKDMRQIQGVAYSRPSPKVMDSLVKCLSSLGLLRK